MLKNWLKLRLIKEYSAGKQKNNHQLYFPFISKIAKINKKIALKHLNV